MIEKLPDGRSLRSEFSLVHGEIAEPDAVALSNNFEFGSARQEFSSRRIHDGRGGTLSHAHVQGDRAADDKKARDRETARQIIQQQAALIAVGLKGEAFDKHEVELPNGQKVTLGALRTASHQINSDFDGTIAAAQRAGVIDPNMSAAQIDLMRGESMNLQAELDTAREAGSGLQPEAISGMSSEMMGLVEFSMRGNSPSAEASYQASAPAPSTLGL